jgi:hypothetical protein
MRLAFPRVDMGFMYVWLIIFIHSPAIRSKEDYEVAQQGLLGFDV